MARACKWVDELAEGEIPYSPSLGLIDGLNCENLAHGDDIILGVDGKSIYQDFIDANRFK